MMLAMLIKFKKLLTAMLVSAMLLVPTTAYADSDIVIRCGEWGTPFDNQVKPGKRVYLSDRDCLNTELRIRKDNKGYYISEWDINKALAKEIYINLRDKGVDADLQVTTCKKDDLNAAGRIARSKNPKIYLSVHHNYCEGANGYLFMYNQGDKSSMLAAKRLSYAIKEDTPVKQRGNAANMRDGKAYIGELNEFKGTDTIAVLGEFGFFNIDGDLKAITDKDVIESVGEAMANELYDMLVELG